MAQYAAYKAPGRHGGRDHRRRPMLLGGLVDPVGARRTGSLAHRRGPAAHHLLPCTFWKSDPRAKRPEQISFNKNVALIGAALRLRAVRDPGGRRRHHDHRNLITL